MFIAAVAVTGIFFSPCFTTSEESGIDKLQGWAPGQAWPSGFFLVPDEVNSKAGSEEIIEVSEPGEMGEITKQEGLVYIYLFPAFGTHVLDPFVRVIERDESNHVAVARVTPTSLETLVLLEEVRGVRTVSSPLVRKVFPPGGNYQDENSYVPGLESFRKLPGVSGKGVRVGIISDGVDSFAGAKAAGVLPGDVQVLAAGNGDEGTAMLEIVHGIAPDAKLYFHEAGSNKLEFNKAVDALLAEGCRIICDDIGWPDEPFFEDGIVASHVREALESQDLLYVSAAGNDANRHYQGMFFDDGSGWHDFSSGKSSSKNLYVDVPPGGEVTVVLQWNDPWDAAGNDYDLYLKDCSGGEELASSKNSQDGKGVPLEFFRYANPEKMVIKGKICIEKYSGEPKVLEVFIYPESRRDIYPDNLVEEDSVFGHPAVPEVLCVGAVGSENGNSTNENSGIAPYSSRGPVSIYFPRSEAREKPDLCGPGSVELRGTDESRNLFAGTSASAPYVAGVAALVWSEQPEKNASEIREILCSTAGDLGAPGYDSTFGYGIVDSSAFTEGQ
ncbi:S8 family peptidase [Methanosarcina sp. Mfa9]|uniref:S8 family peptidase n=1 Tax=Methanosarcina sp. Mfa9 TaxID=3439063 RepID=UPI003F86BD98